MKVTARFWLRAGLVLCAAGALGAFGACSKDTTAWSATASATTGVIGGSTAFTMVGAGEIINTCPNSPGTLGTSHIVDSILTKDTSAIAFVAGDAQTDSVAGSTFASCYDKSG